MITTKTLADTFKAAPSVSDVSGKILLVVDANGNPSQAPLSSPISGLNADRMTTKQLTNEDLNDITDSYCVYIGGNDNTCTNKPNNVTRFSLQVLNNGGGILHILTDMYGHISVRALTGSGWSSWQQLATTDGEVAKLSTKQLTNEDLDSITSSEFTTYRAEGNNTCAHKPSGVTAFVLTVYGRGSNDAVQHIYGFIDNKEHVRIKRGGVWQPWKKMLTEDDIASLVTRIAALEAKVS